MNRSAAALAAAAAIAIVALVLLAAIEAAAAEPASAGRTAYEATCSRCHGSDGRGGRAPWLVPFGWDHAQALDIVRHGSACGMPAFSESELPDRTVEEIVDYLKTLD